jgi:HEAT repeat protein
VDKTKMTADKTLPNVADTKPAMQRKTPSSAQLKAPPMPKPADLKPLESLKDNDEKIEFITGYADEHPESAAIMVYNVLDDSDVEVRTAAMEMLATKELDDPNIVFVADKALIDSEPQVRQSAVEACTHVTDPAVGKVLVDALADESEDVRTAAIELAGQKEPTIRLEVLKAGVASQYEDVREGAISSLTDASSPAAVDILIEGLQNPNPEFREPFKDALDFLLPTDGDLSTYDQYKKWWDANRSKFDNELVEKD